MVRESRHFTDSPWWEYLTWLGIRHDADCFGLLPYSPTSIAGAFMRHALDNKMITLGQVTKAIDTFADGDDPMVAVYEHGGRRFIAICKWQDYQRCRMPSDAACPFPPDQILQKLSPVTRGWITENRDRFAGQITENGDISVPGITENDPPARARAVEKRREEKRREEKYPRPPVSVNAPMDDPDWKAYSAAVRRIPGWPWDEGKDAAFWFTLREEYPGVDLPAVVGRLRVWLQGKGLLPLKGTDRPRARLGRFVSGAYEDLRKRDAEAERPPPRLRDAREVLK